MVYVGFVVCSNQGGCWNNTHIPSYEWLRIKQIDRKYKPNIKYNK